MKKLFLVLAVASLGFVACNNEAETGTSSEDSARIADSTRVADSLANVSMEAVPTAADLEAKRIADSTHIADSIKNAMKK